MVFASVKTLLPDENSSGLSLHGHLETNAANIASLVRDFQKKDKAEFENIAATGKIMAVKSQDITEEPAKAPAEKSVAEKSELDSLLVLYFKSEVEDGYNDLKSFLEKGVDELNQKENIQLLVKKFKSLKEVSMIHGYSGLEYVAQILTSKISGLSGSELGFTKKSIDLLHEIYSDLLSVENYADKSHGKKYVEAIKEKVDQLENSFKASEPVQEPEPTQTEPAVVQEPVVEEAEAVFAMTDREGFEKVIKSFFETISTKVINAHKDILSDESQKTIMDSLELFESNADYFHEQLLTSVSEPLKNYYNSIYETKEQPTPETIDVLESVWTTFAEKEISAIDFELFKTTLSELTTIAKEDSFGFGDEQAQKAFIETAIKEWAIQKENLVDVLSATGDREKAADYLASLKENLTLIEFSNYLPYLDFIQTLFDKSFETPLEKDIASEIENAFKLFFDRMQHHGKNGDCTDILAVLNDITESEVETEEKIIEEVPEIIEEPAPVDLEAEKSEPVEELDEDMALFREEAQGHLKIIYENLEQFNIGSERKNLVEVENSSHAIRSSAHYLNLKDVSKLATAIEEAAELFGKSEFPIPGDLSGTLLKGAATLETLIAEPATAFDAIVEKLEDLLDNIAIEDVGEKGEDQFGFESIEKEQVVPKPTVEEKPLFAEGSEDDEELLEIFREESTTFLANISESNQQLRDNPNNLDGAKNISYASHSLKSAAKMLGFREISQITDSLEQVADGVLNNNIVSSPELNDKINDAVVILEKLSRGVELDTEDISGIIYDLELENWTISKDVNDEEITEDALPENMVTIFVEEARELVAGLNDDYLELEKMPESEMIHSNVLRRLHTLKGSAYISKYNLIGDLAHKLEDFFTLYIQKDSSTKNTMIDTAFLALDLTSDMVDSIEKEGTEEVAQYTTRLAEIDNKIFAFQSFGEPSAISVVAEEVKSEDKPASGPKTRSGEENIIKISTEYMDKLVDMASELMINQTQLGAHLQSLKSVLNDIEGEKKQIHGAENVLEDALEYGLLSDDSSNMKDSEKKEQIQKMSENIKDVVRAVNVIHTDLNKLSEGFEQNIGRLSSISKLLHSDMLKTRMVPVDNLFNRYPRAVRDMAQKQKKKVNLIIEDNNTEMDRAMVEGLAEPILHIIRNAIDHGLESPKERLEQGKSETGTLFLKARQEKNQIVIDIADDGRGIDVENVRNKIVEKGLVEKAQVDKMSEAEILDYIFVAGFSTRDEATAISGRGIGLDSVSNQIQKLKGNIRIKTEQGKGASFSLRVPLTLIISQALMVKVEQQSVAIPVIAVQETIQFKTVDIITDDDKKYIRVRGRLLPYIYLGDILKFNKEENESKQAGQQMAVVIYDAGISMALGITELVGRQEVVIKSLGSHLQNVDYIAGGTILANGDVALILDYALVIRTIELHFFGKVSERAGAKKVTRKIEATQKLEKSATAKARKKPSKTSEKPKKKAEMKEPETETKGSVVKKKIIKNRKPKVIIVDDSNSVRNFVGSILERNGFLTIKSTNGADALEKMKSEKADLMITDLEMPKMHGFDLISNIRGQKKHDSLPIIILTGRAGMKHRQTGEELGANAFIVKPFKEKDLLQSMAEFIEIE